jgi:hypothetical protein
MSLKIKSEWVRDRYSGVEGKQQKKPVDIFLAVNRKAVK